MDFSELRKQISQQRASIDQEFKRDDFERLIQFLGMLSHDPALITTVPLDAAGSMYTFLGILAAEEYLRLYG